MAEVDPNSTDGERVWADYLRRWTAWNHIRAAAAMAAMVLFIVAMRGL